MLQKYKNNFNHLKFIALKNAKNSKLDFIVRLTIFWKKIKKLKMNINNGEPNFTYELKQVFSYMMEVLVDEFPTEVLTPEYLMVSMLDTSNCHANMIIYNWLKDEDIETLRMAYTSVLKDYRHSQKKNGDVSVLKIILSEELEDLIDAAEAEANSIEVGSPIGSEHILLAILNKANKLKITKVLENSGLRYDAVRKQLKPSKAKTKEVKPKLTQIPPKSQINNSVNSVSVGNHEFIEKYTQNINKLVKEHKIDNLVGREKEINQIIRVMARRKKNNVILVGDGGCGTTSIAFGLAQRIENGNVPDFLEGKQLVMLDSVGMVSGTNFRGMLEERVNGLFKELKGSKRYILLLDDIQSMLKNSSKDSDMDLGSSLGDILSDGNVCVIGTATQKGYRNAVEANPQISRKFQKIVVEPATKDEAVEMLYTNKRYYEEFHRVKFTKETIKHIVLLADRYITNRKLPDSAFDVMDITGAMAGLANKDDEVIVNAKKELNSLDASKADYLNSGNFEKIDEITKRENELKAIIAEGRRKAVKSKKIYSVTSDDVAKTVSEMTGIPVGRLSASEKQKVANIDNILKKSIVGQDEAINAVCRVIKRNKVGLGNKSKTQGVFLCCGPSGVGKTLLAKKLAEEIYGSDKDLVRIDMSEYSEKSSVSKLTGASPGYVGYENGGQLTEAIKNKQYCVLLLDEIEKANQEVFNVFLQLFDEGRLTDSAGQVVNFKNIIVIMTSNVGARDVAEFGSGVGFYTNKEANKNSIISKQLKRTFSPEFLNRIDQIVYFNSLTDENLKGIIRLELGNFSKRLSELGFKLKCTDAVIDFLFQEATKEKNMGARPVIRLIQTNIEDKITDLLLINNYKKNHTFKFDCVDGVVDVVK